MNVKLNVERNIAACCSPDSSKYVLSSVQLLDNQHGKVYATATGGKCLSVSIVEGEIDEPCLLPSAAIPRSGNSKVIGNGEWRTRRGKNKIKETVTEASDGVFPAAYKILKKLEPDKHTAITVNILLLADLAAAIGENGQLTLLVGGPEDPIGVDGAFGFGVIMPMISTDKKLGKYNTKVRDYVEIASEE